MSKQHILRVCRLVSSVLACAAMFLAISAHGAKEPPPRLDVNAQPEGAQVSVDGKPCGAAPCQLFDLAPGTHHIHVAAPSCSPADEFVKLEPGGYVQKTFALSQEKGLILIRTKPAGATVKYNGASLGPTPLLVTTLPSGQTHAFELSLNGYQSKRIDVSVEGRTPVVRDETLALDSGTVDCSTEPPGATIIVNGVERGTSPATLTHIPKGLAAITVKLNGYKEESRELRLAPGDRQTLALTLKPLPARLNVISSPEQARVFLDTDYQGKTPVTISAAPGKHELRVELAGHATVTRSVTLENGAEKTEEFKLSNVLGRLEVITTPPGAKISIDGKAVGTTKAQGEAPRSQILPLENIIAGEHSVMAHLDGYQDVSRRVTVKASDTSKLYLKLPRVFTPDTEVITTWNRDGIRGVLVNKDYLGNLTIETSPGVSTTIKAEDIRSVKPLLK